MKKIAIHVLAFIAGGLLAFLLNFQGCEDKGPEDITIPNNGEIVIDTKPEDVLSYDSTKHVYQIKTLIAETHKLKNSVSTKDNLLKDALGRLDKSTQSILSLKQQISLTADLNIETDTLIQIIEGKSDTVIQFVGFSYLDEFLSLTIREKEFDPGVFEMSLLGDFRTTVEYRSVNKMFRKTRHLLDISIDYPNFFLIDAESIMIEPHVKRISIGTYIGYGTTYDIKSKAFILGPQIGAGLNFRIF